MLCRAIVRAGTAGGGSLSVEEIGGAPSVSGVSTIKVSNGSLTDNGGGMITLNFIYDIDGGLFGDTYTYNNNIDGGGFV